MRTPMDNMIYSASTNLVDIVVDEVALEGLDGITLEALSQRLAMRLSTPSPLSQSTMKQIWTICTSMKELIFYELAEPREALIIFDRYKFVDPDLGTIMEPDDLPEDIYKHCPIDDTKNGIKGSCMDYKTRKPIENIRNMRLEAVQKKYGRRLVIVGSQSCRQNALLGDSVCPIVELNIVQYCFLERVGRARYHGEITQGKRSLSMLKEEPKSLFYHRKFLTKHKLITKQTHHQKNSGHGTSGSLLHLPRFYVERKPKLFYLAERIIEILRSRENGLVDYEEIKRELRIERVIKNLFKLSFFQKVVRSDLMVPWRTLYPDAKPSEWQKKGVNKEKIIRAVQLVDPNIDIHDLWNKDDNLEDEESYELDISGQLINVSLLKQANNVVEAAGYDGISQSELSNRMGLTKLQSRTILRNLAKVKIVGTYMNDIGRQRITKYVAKKFEKNSDISKQFQTEVEKMNEHTRTSNLENASKPIQTTKEFLNPIEENPTVENVDVQMKAEGHNEDCPQRINRRRLFSLTNQILGKYKMSKYIKYNVTHCNLAEMKDLPSKIQLLSCKIAKNSRRGKKQIEPNDSDDFCEVVLQETKIEGNYKGELRNITPDYSNNTGNLSVRILKRANMIIESVKEHKVIHDMTKLMKMINEAEDREGYDVKIDKKSLIRLLQKLAMDNFVKNIKLTLSTKGKKKCLTFICHPSININHSVIQSAVEQARIKFCIMRTNKSKTHNQSSEKSSNKSSKSSQKTSADKIIPTNIIPDPRAGKRYGYSPKFVRMQIIHLLLYHIVYNHPGPPKVSRSQQIERLRERGHQIDDAMEEEMGEIFSTQISWKMFIPPLPIHNGWPLGWTLMSDILLRIPLSIFLKVYKNPYTIPDLQSYIDHPIRQHYLVKDLPTPLRNALLMKRKYIFSVHETITRLCYIGLVQFGPQKLKEKDQVFIYLNRKSELTDTTSSAAHYHQVEDKKYPVVKYFFDNTQAVEKYWYDMLNTCINTQLGGRLIVQGTDIILEDLSKKSEMLETLKPRGPKEAIELDMGIMPGDKKGAAGIDSAFFPHLKRNWNWENFHTTMSSVLDQENSVECGARNTRLSKVEAKPINFKDYTGLKTNSGPTHLDVRELKLPKNQKKKTVTVATVDKMLRQEILTGKVKKQNAIVRRVMPRKQTTKARVKYDDIDYSALQKMNKLRVDWDPREDNILLVCKVVMMYLCPNPRSQKLITSSAVRDVLRLYSLSSHNKTSKACRRRLLYMMKRPQTVHSVALGVEEIKQNYYINRRYGDIVNKIRKINKSNDLDEKIAQVFKNLVAYVANKYYDLSQKQADEQIYKPNTIQEFNLLYEISHPQKPQSTHGFKNDVRSVNDIHTATINSVIYSSMSCGKDRRSWAYQLFKIYQQYPELLLRNAMGKIRSDQMVSMKKNYVNALKKYGNCMPMSSSQYQLSTSYIHKFNMKLPAECYQEMFEFFMKIMEGYEQNSLGQANGIQVLPPSGGMVVGVEEFLKNEKIDFNIEIPDHIIALDPKLQEFDETYIRIAKRYQDILTSLEEHHVDRVPENAEEDDDDDGEEGEEGEKVNVTNKMNDDVEMAEIGDANLKESFGNKIEKINLETASSSFVKQNPKKSVQTKNHWTLAHVKLSLIGEDRDDEDENNANDDGKNMEINSNDDDAWNNFIRLEDGTKIPITREDIEMDKLSPLDDKIHKAFLKTRTEDNVVDDFPACSIIGKLKSLFVEAIPMEIDSNCWEKTEEKRKKVESAQNLSVIVGRKEKEVFQNSNYVNDIIANINCVIESSNSVCQREEDSTDVKKRYTRIALLKMREELNEDLPDSHHAHEYFVVSTFGIFYSLPQLDEEKIHNAKLTIDNKLKSKMLMLDEEIYKKVLSDLKEFAIFPRDFPDILKIKQVLKAEKNFQEKDIDMIYEYIRSKREQGATLGELSSLYFKSLGRELYEILFHLTQRRLFLRSGVTEAHYIHHNFVGPWLIQSIRIMRLQRESLPQIPPSTVYVFDSNNENNENTKEKSEELNSKNNEMNDGEKNINEGLNSMGQKTIRRNRTCLLQTKEVHSAAKKLDLNTAEDINVVVRPWIRIDGLLNRSVLEQMLGAVLAHCVMHPGIFLSKVQERFVPALQPYHTRELVETLVKLGCLELKTLQKGPSTLFSHSAFERLSDPLRKDGASEFDNEIIIESTVGSTLRFATFIRGNHDRLSSSS